jgi:hypothetical protein
VALGGCVTQEFGQCAYFNFDPPLWGGASSLSQSFYNNTVTNTEFRRERPTRLAESCFSAYTVGNLLSIADTPVLRD